MIKSFKKIPSAIVWIGIVYLLINFSSAAFSILANTYMVKILKFNMSDVGWISGVVEGMGWILRIFSGIVSDFFLHRKFLLIIAFSMIFSSRFLVTCNYSQSSFITSRFIDRSANALQASPREALISDLSSSKNKGAAYGIRHSLAVVGSALGAIFAGIIGKNLIEKEEFSHAFLLTSIPVVLAIFCILFFIKEKKQNTENETKPKFHIKSIGNLSLNYWLVVLIAAVYNLSVYGIDVLNMYVCSKGISHSHTMALQNIITALVAYPFAMFSDKFGRNIPLLIAFVIAILANFVMAASVHGNSNLVYLGVILNGIPVGASQSILLAKIAEVTEKNLRATAFGIYYFCAGISVILSNTIFGNIGNRFGVFYSFGYSLFMSFVALIVFIVIIKILKTKNDINNF